MMGAAMAVMHRAVGWERQPALLDSDPMSPSGVACAVAAAALFGVSTPLAKAFLRDVEPLMLAGLLYVGAGLGLVVLGIAGRRIRPDEAPLAASDVPPLVAVVVAGGIVGPILMLHGLQRVSGVTGSLLLNLEAPFTIAVAVALFGEHLSPRAAAAALSYPAVVKPGDPIPFKQRFGRPVLVCQTPEELLEAWRSAADCEPENDTFQLLMVCVKPGVPFCSMRPAFSRITRSAIDIAST